MRSLGLTAAALVLLTFCSPDNTRRNNETGMAQDGGGSLSAPDTVPSPTGDSIGASGGAPSPAGILSQLYIANSSEIQLSKLAARKAASPKLKQVANTLAADHARNRQEERALAQRLNVTLTPAAGGNLAASDSAVLPPELQGKAGSEFDKAFVEYEVREHEAGIEKIRTELLPAAQNAEVQAYLQKTLTTMQEHLADLKQVQQQLG